MISICIFFIIGAIDYFIGNRFGLGGEFERAFNLVGKVILSAVGMVTLSPVLAEVLKPFIVPVLSAIGADPSMFAPTFLSPDLGGYSIAIEMGRDQRISAWAGTVVAASIGSSFSFNIPVCIGIIKKEHYRHFALGAMSGLIASPFGCILGGIMSGIPIGLVLLNMIPTFFISGVVIAGLLLIPYRFMSGFIVFGRILSAVALFGLTISTIQRLTGYVLIQGMKPISDGFLIAGTVGLTMGGILCMSHLLARVLKKPLKKYSERLKLDEISVLSTINSLATVVSGAVYYNEMNGRGKALFGAAVTSFANILGAHLSYVGINAPEMVPVMIVAKIVSGIIAIIIAMLFYNHNAAKLEKATEIEAVNARRSRGQ